MFGERPLRTLARWPLCYDASLLANDMQRQVFLALISMTSLALAEPLRSSVSWIGNSFPGGDQGWVPQDV